VAVERWYYIKDGYLWKHTEPDGIAYLRNRTEITDVPLCTVEEALVKYPIELRKAMQ
jgi:hypothetical protein